MKTGELIAEIAREFIASGIANGGMEARWLVCELSGAGRADCELDAAKCKYIHQAADRRIAGVPLQYVIGTAPFRNLVLKVDSRVLIPRPETEELPDYLFRHLPAHGSCLDLGCGSGAIALAVASERSDAVVTAADVSSEALALARENQLFAQVDNQVEFLESNLFSALPGRRFDCIAANLPYVTEAEYPMLDAEVRDYEPKLALVASEQGLKLILQAIAQLPEHLNDGGYAIFEMSPHQTAAVAAAWKNDNWDITILPDLTGRARFVAGVYHA